MKLTKNVHIDGVWYGPDYGDQDLPPEVEARLGQPSVDIATANNVARVRSLLMSGVARVVEDQVIPAFARLPLDEQHEELEAADGEFAEFIESVAGKLATAPAPAAEVLSDDDAIVLAEGRFIRRGDLVAILDLLEETGMATEDPRADQIRAEAVETARVLADPSTKSVIDEASSETPIEVPEGSVDELLAFVHGGDPGEPATDGWRQRADAVLAAELAGGHPRKTLVEPLERALDADPDEDEVT